jgi:hypothetical protein
VIKIVVIVEVPDEQGQAWFQHVRDFDVRVSGCKFNMFAVAPDKTVGELSEMLNVQPPLAHKKIIKEQDDV